MILYLFFNLFIFFFNINTSEIIGQAALNNSIQYIDKNKNVYIRVLLDEFPLGKYNASEISSAKDIILRTKSFKLKADKLVINVVRNKVYLNNKKLSDKIIKIDPVEGYLKFKDKQYQGSFFLVIDDNKLLIINRVELEDYIFSVLFTESWPGWPLEVNKAFAIASRSYVIAKLLENKSKTGRFYHVRNTNKHQTYTGIHKSDNLRFAVEETKGIVLGYNKKPILAMFDACCGGIIPANIKGINFKKVPYLERKEQCIFCKSCKLYSWKIEYKHAEFEKTLKKELPKLNNIKTIQTIKDDSGVVHKVYFKNKNATFNISGKKLYSLFDKIKSFAFSIDYDDSNITVRGNGYGHHLGLCQWGAREMINLGWDYEGILKFSYPGTSFMKLKLNKIFN